MIYFCMKLLNYFDMDIYTLDIYELFENMSRGSPKRHFTKLIRFSLKDKKFLYALP